MRGRTWQHWESRVVIHEYPINQGWTTHLETFLKKTPQIYWPVYGCLFKWNMTCKLRNRRQLYTGPSHYIQHPSPQLRLLFSFTISCTFWIIVCLRNVYPLSLISYKLGKQCCLNLVDLRYSDVRWRRLWIKCADNNLERDSRSLFLYSVPADTLKDWDNECSKADVYPVGQLFSGREIFRIRSAVHQILLPVHSKRQLERAHVFTPYIPNITFNTILLFTFKSSKWLIVWGLFSFSTKML